MTQPTATVIGYYNIINMIGSLAEFIALDQGQLFQEVGATEKQEKEVIVTNRKKRGQSAFETYQPQDKTELLLRYEKNNIFHINRKKATSLAKQAQSKATIRRPLYEHRSFFAKPEIARDYIAKQELKRKHNLLRAILRMKQNEEEPRGDSDYEQSFQRLYSGFRAVHPQPILAKDHAPKLPDPEIAAQKMVVVPPLRNAGSLSHRKRLEYEHCLSWARKHQKQGDFFARQLGKLQSGEKDLAPVLNRSLIEEIGKKVQFSLLD